MTHPYMRARGDGATQQLLSAHASACRRLPGSPITPTLTRGQVEAGGTAIQVGRVRTTEAGRAALAGSGPVHFGTLSRCPSFGRQLVGRRRRERPILICFCSSYCLLASNQLTSMVTSPGLMVASVRSRGGVPT